MTISIKLRTLFFTILMTITIISTLNIFNSKAQATNITGQTEVDNSSSMDRKVVKRHHQNTIGDKVFIGIIGEGDSNISKNKKVELADVTENKQGNVITSDNLSTAATTAATTADLTSTKTDTKTDIKTDIKTDTKMDGSKAQETTEETSNGFIEMFLSFFKIIGNLLSNLFTSNSVAVDENSVVVGNTTDIGSLTSNESKPTPTPTAQIAQVTNKPVHTIKPTSTLEPTKKTNSIFTAKPISDATIKPTSTPTLKPTTKPSPTTKPTPKVKPLPTPVVDENSVEEFIAQGLMWLLSGEDAASSQSNTNVGHADGIGADGYLYEGGHRYYYYRQATAEELRQTGGSGYGYLNGSSYLYNGAVYNEY